MTAPRNEPTPLPAPLKALAEMMGVQTRYQSAFGTEVEASAAALVAVLNVLGVPVRADLSNVDRVCEDQLRALWAEAADPVSVFWERRPQRLLIRHSADTQNATVTAVIKTEQGAVHRVKAALSRLPVTRRMRIGGALYLERAIPVERRLPLGYHSATISLGRRALGGVLIIAAPWHAYRPERDPKARRLGLFAPLYAVRSPDNWGIGDFGDLRRLTEQAGALGADFVGTLPMLATFNDRPMVEPSPYAPVSRVFWNEIYVDPRQAPEWSLCESARRRAGSPAFRAAVERLRAAPQVDYRAVARLKRPIIADMARCFFERGGDRTPEFKAFLAMKPTVTDYARFRAVCDARGTVFSRWPDRQRDGSLGDGDGAADDVRYYLYSQWLAHTQLAELARTAKRDGQGIYIDYPLSLIHI